VRQLPAEINGVLASTATDFKDVVSFRELVLQNVQDR
jgi:hypothetical protein